MSRLNRSQLLALGLVVVVLSAAIPLTLAVPDMVLDDAPPMAEVHAAAAEVASVEVLSGSAARDVAVALASQEAVDSARRFEVLVSLLGYAGRLTPGFYDFEPGLVTMEIIERIRDNITSAFVITIPEGLRIEEIALRLENAGIADHSDFLAAADNPANWAGTLTAQRSLRTSLEGYLFPSTYRFALTVTPDEVVRTMLERFDAQITPDRRAAIEASGRTLHDILVIASIVEREAVLAEERPSIASVFWNRVEAGMQLEADPTVQYAVAAATGQRIALWLLESGVNGSRLGRGLALQHLSKCRVAADTDRGSRHRVH